MSDKDYEFYETPAPAIRYLIRYLNRFEDGIRDRKCFEPCVGAGAIPLISSEIYRAHWQTNDLDPRWKAHSQLDATQEETFHLESIDWTITNTPFSKFIEIIKNAIENSRIGVAAYSRISIHEPTKSGVRRTWFADNPPTAILFLPRFSHQRSKTKGIWSTDSVTSCWNIWTRHAYGGQFIEYAPTSVLTEMEKERPEYRERMDKLNGLAGSEEQRQAAWIARWKKDK